MDIDRTQFPLHTQLQGMAAQAAQWFLVQIERNEMTVTEAAYIAHHLHGLVLDLMRRQEQEQE